jgi:hypothetical protein
MISRRRWMGGASAAVALSSASGAQAAAHRQTHQTTRVALLTSAAALPAPAQQATWQLGALRFEAHIDAATRTVELRRDGGLTHTLGGAPLSEQWLNAPVALAYNTTSQQLAVATAAGRVHLLSAQGQWLSKFGAWGDAPGEWLGLSDMAIGEQGDLWLSDPVLGVVHRFSATGKFVSRHSVTDAWGKAVVPQRLSLSAGRLQVHALADASSGLAICRSHDGCLA